MEENERKLYERAIKVWGIGSQINMAIEEMAELTHALTRIQRNDGKDNTLKRMELVEEVVDVQIMLQQLKLIFISDDDMRNYYDKTKAEKLLRLKHLLDFVEEEKLFEGA